jgi:hypothetical protein
MIVWLLPVFFLAAFLCYLAALLTGITLGPERIGAAPTRRAFWTAWIPGEFTSRGRTLRRRVGLLTAAGTVLWAVALILSHIIARAA